MLRRTLASLALLAAICLPAFAGDKAEKPVMTAQGKPTGKILGDIKKAAKEIGGEHVANELDEKIKDKLGDKGFLGLDLDKPTAGYAVLSGKEQEVGFVVLIPVTDEKNFVEFLGRIDVAAEEEKEHKGLYRLTPEKAGNIEGTIYMRVKDRYAYIGIKTEPEDLEADKLIPIADLIDPADDAMMSFRIHYDRFTAEWKKSMVEQSKKKVEEFNKLPLPEKAKEIFAEVSKMQEALTKQIMEDGKTGTMRINFDADKCDLTMEGALTAKKDSGLAKEIAARKATVNRFAGLRNSKTAGGLALQIPLFSEEYRKMIEGLIGQAEEMAPVPEEYKKLAQEVFKGAARTVKSGELDTVFTLNGPDKDGLYVFAGAFSFDDPSGVEKELKEMLKNAPEGVQNMIKLDAGKVGKVNIHQAPIGAFLPKEAKEIFGEDAKLCIAFDPKGVYITFGTSAMDEMKAALKSEPAEAKAMDIFVNPSRLEKIAENDKKGEAKKFIENLRNTFGKDDKAVSLVSGSISGGDELKIRFSMNLKMFHGESHHAKPKKSDEE